MFFLRLFAAVVSLFIFIFDIYIEFIFNADNCTIIGILFIMLKDTPFKYFLKQPIL